MIKSLEKLNKLKIAYYPYSEDFSFCGDRRRFCFFANSVNLIFSKYRSNDNYDIVVFSPFADLKEIKKIKSKRSKIILELVDSYFIKTNLLEDLLRYLAKQFLHKNYLQIFLPRRYTSELRKALKMVDAVICSTEDQKKRIKKYNPNVHIVLDSHENELLLVEPNRNLNKKCLNILWEGLAPNLINFEEIASELNEAGKKIDINLHILTDLVSYKFCSRFYKVHASDLIKKYNLQINTYLYQWNKTALSSLASICDLAIIPLLQNNKFVLGKPENKLILLWKLGLPVFTSNSEVYSLTMEKAGLNMVCTGKGDWRDSIIEFYKFDNAKRKSISNQVKEFAEKNYTKDKLIKKWENVFYSVL